MKYLCVKPVVSVTTLLKVAQLQSFELIKNIMILFDVVWNFAEKALIVKISEEEYE